jgi:hypothetical protein
LTTWGAWHNIEGQGETQLHWDMSEQHELMTQVTQQTDKNSLEMSTPSGLHHLRTDPVAVGIQKSYEAD